MLKSNLLILYRNYKRDRGSFIINLIGLSTGLACALLIYLWVNDERSIDKFHEKDGSLYQVLTTHPNEEGIDTWDAGPVPLAPALAEEMPEIGYAVSYSPIIDNFTLTTGDLHISASGHFADNNFFNIFSYKLSQGDLNNVLSDKNAIVISESIAFKLFDTTEDIIGKTIKWEYLDNKRDVVVTGIFKDIPKNSSDQFDFILSFEEFKDIQGEYANWGNHQAKICLALKEGTDVKQFSNKIADFIKTRSKESNVKLLIQKYSDQYLYNNFENGMQSGGRIEQVRLFSLIAIFIILIACINFMNLSTAKAFRRIKEVGIKKANGASRVTLIFQHLGESVFMTILSFIAAIILVQNFLPQFNEIIGNQLALVPDIKLIISFLLITICTGLIAGSYPAFYLSGFKPAIALKWSIDGELKNVIIRKGLVVTQFALTVILIVSMVVIYDQINFIQTKNSGFERDNILSFKIEGKIIENLEPFLYEINNIPGVIYCSSMRGSIINETGITQGDFDWEGKSPDDIVAFSHLGVNYDMLELLGIKTAEGRTFSQKFGDETSKIIINETGIAVMGLKNPVGKKFNLWGQDYEIIGVAKDFNYRSLHEKVKPFFFRYTPENANKVWIKIQPGSSIETINKIEALYKSFNPGFVFNYQFLDQDFQMQYIVEQRTAVMSKFFAGLAILISCLGLFGLASYTAERRQKEIGIRKVYGSGEIGIVKLLSGEFTGILILAIAIALPVSYLVTNSWLSGYAYRVDLKWWYFAGSGIVTMLIAWITVGLQTYKSAILNPVDALRSE